MQLVFLTDIHTSLKDYIEVFTWISLMLDACKCQITKNLLLHINKSLISLYKLRLRKEDISVHSRQMNWNVSLVPSNPPHFQLYLNQDAQDIITSFRITHFPTSPQQSSQMCQSTPTSIQTISLALGEHFMFLLLQSAICHQGRNLLLEMYQKCIIRFPFMHLSGQEPLFGSRMNYSALIHACASDYDHQLELMETLWMWALIFFMQMALDRHQDGSIITYFFTFLENTLQLTMNRKNYGTKRSLGRVNIKTKEGYSLVGMCSRMGPWRSLMRIADLTSKTYPEHHQDQKRTLIFCATYWTSTKSPRSLTFLGNISRTNCLCTLTHILVSCGISQRMKYFGRQEKGQVPTGNQSLAGTCHAHSH
jgi:hypothetical protein